MWYKVVRLTRLLYRYMHAHVRLTAYMHRGAEHQLSHPPSHLGQGGQQMQYHQVIIIRRAQKAF